MASFENIQSHLTDHLGIALSDFGKIVMPMPTSIKLPWGGTDRMYTNPDYDSYQDNISGKTRTESLYNASTANKSTDCAIGYAYNYSRMVAGKGIGPSQWYIPSSYDSLRYILPNWEKMCYVSMMLLGFAPNSLFWVAEDGGTAHGRRFSAEQGNVTSVAKTSTNIGLVLMADLQDTFQTT